jgi:threonine dehydratase
LVTQAGNAYTQSFEQGRIVSTDTDTEDISADGMACRIPAPEVLEIIREGAARIVRVDHAQLRRAIAALHEDTKPS